MVLFVFYVLPDGVVPGGGDGAACICYCIDWDVGAQQVARKFDLNSCRMCGMKSYGVNTR